MAGAYRAHFGHAWAKARRQRLSKRQQRWILWSMSVLAAAMFGILLAGGCQGGAKYTVNVRTGSPLPLEGNRALVVLPGGMVEQVVKQGIAQADMPFDLSGVKVHYSRDGIAISGDADVGVTVFSVGLPFSTLVHPVASGDGKLAIHLSNTKAVGGKLPVVFQDALEGAVNSSLKQALAVQDYRIEDVEQSDQGLYVYILYTPLAGAAPLSTGLQQP